jgi:hypothetical protein
MGLLRTNGFESVFMKCCSKLEDIALATVIHPLGGFLVVVCSHRS